MIEQIKTILEAASAPISQTLIHSIWQGGLIATFLALGLILLKGSDPRLRYLISCCAMAFIVILSLATGWYLIIENSSDMVLLSGDRLEPAAMISDAAPKSGSIDSGVASMPMAAGGSGRNYKSLLHWFFPAWIIGVLVISVYHLAGWRRVKRFVSKKSMDISEDWRRRLLQLCGTLKIRRPVGMVMSSWACVPCVIGWIKPVILIPIGTLSGLGVDDLEMILAHELAHIRRNDVLFGYIQTAIETVFFFNPAIWWISRQIRIEREHCCDDRAIEFSGDRLGYARALTHLEELRGRQSGLAMAAAGSLVHRIRRLAGLSASPYRASGTGAVIVFLLTVTLVLGLGSIGGSMPADIGESDQNMTESYNPGSDDIKGDWEIEAKRGHFNLRIYFNRNWQSGFSLKPEEFTPQITASTKYFQLRRDAGTFHFKGEFEDAAAGLRGEGECYFKPDPGYVEAMEKYGFRLKSTREVLKFALHNITLDYVDGLITAGYDDLSSEQLLKAHIHDVTPGYIAELDDLGYRDLDMEELVKMKIHDVEPEIIREYQKLGYAKLSQSQLVKMQIHDVDPEYIAELSDLGYKDLDCEELVEMKIHDVEPEIIRQYKELGHRELSEAELVKMQIHDVDPGFIEAMHDLGYEDLDCEELVSMKIHDVEPSFIRKMAELGYKDIDPEMLVSLQIHDVTPRFISSLSELGYKNVSLADLVSMQIHDVTASYIRSLKRRGYDGLTVEELIERKIHDD